MSNAVVPVVSSLLVESRIYTVRNQRVMIDFELAELYGVTTIRLNEQVQRNLTRFPEDFAFQMTLAEFKGWESLLPPKSTSRGGRRKLPWVFTEHGVSMLSSVLRSDTAVRVNIEIIRAFVRMRRLLATPGELVAQLQELATAVLFHEDQIEQINEVLNTMLSPPPTPAKEMGFHTIHSKKKAKGS